jgi:ComF family protein
MNRYYTEQPVGEHRALTHFNDPHIKALIHEAKYASNTRAHALLGTLITIYLTHHSLPEEALWVPIPLSRARLRMRGYNQIEEVLRTVPELKKQLAADVLTRSRATRPQTELTREERLLNVRDAFSSTRGDRVTGRDIFLIDDVTTTGATLTDAKRALLIHHPRSVTTIALAH